MQTIIIVVIFVVCVLCYVFSTIVHISWYFGKFTQVDLIILQLINMTVVTKLILHPVCLQACCILWNTIND